MKEIKAYIKPHKLADVTSVLGSVAGLTGMTVFECRGFGRGAGTTDEAQQDGPDEFRKSVKLEIVCSDNLADQVVTAIETAAHTGLKGDGKIHVSEISRAVRISTGETGDSAV